MREKPGIIYFSKISIIMKIGLSRSGDSKCHVSAFLTFFIGR